MRKILQILFLLMLYAPAAEARTLSVPTDPSVQIAVREYWNEILVPVDPLSLTAVSIEALDQRPLRSGYLGWPGQTVLVLLIPLASESGRKAS